MLKYSETEAEIAGILKTAQEDKVPVAEISSRYGLSKNKIYYWRSRLAAKNNATRMKELEEENTLLKKLYSDVVVQCESAKAELAECKKAAAKPETGAKKQPRCNA